jgi:hypothetical protein
MIYTESPNKQGTPEWFDERRGIPTGSEAKRFITATGKYSESQGKDSYIAELVAAACGWIPNFDGNDDTERGNYLESEALRWLQLRQGVRVRPAGFCLHESGKYGTSPDGFDENGLPTEVKAPALHTFIKWQMKGGLPPEHKAQVHFHMAVTGAPACHFIGYADSEYIDNMHILVERDEFTEKVTEAVTKFCGELEDWQRKLTGDEYEAIFT